MVARGLEIASATQLLVLVTSLAIIVFALSPDPTEPYKAALPELNNLNQTLGLDGTLHRRSEEPLDSSRIGMMFRGKEPRSNIKGMRFQVSETVLWADTQLQSNYADLSHIMKGFYDHALVNVCGPDLNTLPHGCSLGQHNLYLQHFPASVTDRAPCSCGVDCGDPGTSHQVECVELKKPIDVWVGEMQSTRRLQSASPALSAVMGEISNLSVGQGIAVVENKIKNQEGKLSVAGLEIGTTIGALVAPLVIAALLLYILLHLRWIECQQDTDKYLATFAWWLLFPGRLAAIGNATTTVIVPVLASGLMIKRILDSPTPAGTVLLQPLVLLALGVSAGMTVLAIMCSARIARLRRRAHSLQRCAVSPGLSEGTYGGP